MIDPPALRSYVNIPWLVCLSIGLLAYEGHIYSGLYTEFCVLFIFCLACIVIRFDFDNVSKYFCILKDRKNIWVVALVSVTWIYHSMVSVFHDDPIAVIRSLLFFPLVFLSLESAKHKNALFECFVVLSVVCALISFGIQVGLFNLWGFIFLRNASIFFDPNYAGVVFGFALVLCLTVYTKPFRFVAAPVLFSALLLTYSRGAYLAFMISLAAIVFASSVLRNFKWWGLVVVLGFGVITWWAVDYDLMVMRLAHGSSGRLAMWWVSFREILVSANIFGVGSEGLHELLMRYGMGNTSTHSFFIDSMVIYGLPAFLMWLALVCFAMWRSWCHKSDTLPALVFVFVASNFVVISIGGIGLLSFLYCMLVIYNSFDLGQWEGPRVLSSENN